MGADVDELVGGLLRPAFCRSCSRSAAICFRYPVPASSAMAGSGSGADAAWGGAATAATTTVLLTEAMPSPAGSVQSDEEGAASAASAAATIAAAAAAALAMVRFSDCFSSFSGGAAFSFSLPPAPAFGFAFVKVLGAGTPIRAATAADEDAALPAGERRISSRFAMVAAPRSRAAWKAELSAVFFRSKIAPCVKNTRGIHKGHLHQNIHHMITTALTVVGKVGETSKEG